MALFVLLSTTALALQAGAQLRDGRDSRSARAVVVHVEGGLQVTLSTSLRTSARRVEFAGPAMRAFPTIDITCDGKLRTFPLLGSEDGESRTVAVYELPRGAADAMLNAAQCRLFVPGRAVALPRNQRWAAWADPSKGTEAPKVLGARVLEVVDGHTIKVGLGDRTETVRYIGINTPETTHPTRGAEPGGREAAEVNRTLVAGRQVRLELDVQERDRDGRLLAYVYVGDVMVNAALVGRGHAHVMTVPPNVRHQEVFATLERSARAQKRGLWATSSDNSTEPVAAAPTRPGIAPQDAWTCPATHPIKGNFTTYSGERCIYHLPGGEFYGKTKPERCYTSEGEARQEGCRRSKR